MPVWRSYAQANGDVVKALLAAALGWPRAPTAAEVFSPAHLPG